MSDNIVIAVDAMGGDDAPRVVLEGCEDALASDPSLQVVLCGPASIVVPFAEEHDRCVAQPAEEVIAMGEHPANAVRKKKDSSIVVGCRVVKEGGAQGFFSAGSTGACLAAATLVMGRIKGISRPALATIVPALARPVLLTDVGANADCKPAYLVQFAQMATIYMEKVIGVENPQVALLNIGEEEAKGSVFAQQTHSLLREQVPNFAGNGEGGDLLAGKCDIFVTDGFTGNVCLKTIEGTSKALFGMMKDVFKASFSAKLAALALRDGLKGLKESVSPDTYGGAPLLGVRGACVVGHGSSSALAVKNGILTTANIARQRVAETIEQAVARVQEEG